MIQSRRPPTLYSQYVGELNSTFLIFAGAVAHSFSQLSPLMRPFSDDSYRYIVPGEYNFLGVRVWKLT